MTATADLPNKNIKAFTEKFNFDDNDYSIIIDGSDGNKIKLIAKTLMKGDMGDTGTGISSIVLTSTVGAVDTYTITYTDASTSTFDVTNGTDGADGTDGDDGVGISSITLTGTVGNVDTYTIIYTDASTTTFDVTNGTDGADGTSFDWLGEYAGGTTYAVNDTVSYNGSSYICILESTGNLPTNATYWELMAAKGTDGAGSGDMLASVYDPTTVAGDAFSMGNMVETATKKILTDTERTAISTNSAKVSYPGSADATELNILDGATLTTTELNYVDGVTSAIQTQLNAKQATLVSGTNIKTVNSTSILGSGDIEISGGGGESTQTEVTAAEDITAGNAVCYDSGYKKTDASDSDKINFVGFASETVTSGNTFKLDTAGVNTNQSGLTTGSEYYLSDTAGAISTSAGTNSVKVGKAISATGLEIYTGGETGNYEFSGKDSSSITLTTTYQVLTYGTELLDKGGNFTHTTGIFKAPVTGNYYFSINILLGTGFTAGDFLECNYLKNGSNIYNSAYRLSSESFENYSSSLMLPLTKGNTVSFNIKNSTASRGTINSRNFCGFKLS